MSEFKGSKLPWKVSAVESGQIGIDSADEKEVTGFINHDDAFLIIKPFNLHAELLEALKYARRFVNESCDVGYLDSVIAKALGKGDV